MLTASVQICDRKVSQQFYNELLPFNCNHISNTMCMYTDHFWPFIDTYVKEITAMILH